MTKSGLIKAVAQRFHSVSSRDVEGAVNTLFDAMTEALAAGRRIEIRGFGSFTVRRRRARLGRNPKTGQEIFVPGKCTPFFTVGNDLRERVNGGAVALAQDSVHATAAVVSRPHTMNEFSR